MTNKEIKKKIDGLILGLHSTNPGDINAVKDLFYTAAGFIPGIEKTETKEISLEQYQSARSAGVIRLTNSSERTFVSGAFPTWVRDLGSSLLRERFPEIQSVGDIGVYTDLSYYEDNDWDSAFIIFLAYCNTTDGDKCYMAFYEA